MLLSAVCHVMIRLSSRNHEKIKCSLNVIIQGYNKYSPSFPPSTKALQTLRHEQPSPGGQRYFQHVSKPSPRGRRDFRHMSKPSPRGRRDFRHVSKPSPRGRRDFRHVSELSRRARRRLRQSTKPPPFNVYTVSDIFSCLLIMLSCRSISLRYHRKDFGSAYP